MFQPVPATPMAAAGFSPAVPTGSVTSPTIPIKARQRLSFAALNGVTVPAGTLSTQFSLEHTRLRNWVCGENPPPRIDLIKAHGAIVTPSLKNLDGCPLISGYGMHRAS